MGDDLPARRQRSRLGRLTREGDRLRLQRRRRRQRPAGGDRRHRERRGHRGDHRQGPRPDHGRGVPSRSAGERVPSGSAATDEAGTYELASLLPGTYKLSFSAEGFEPLWYPDAANPDDAALIEVAPKKTVPDLDVVLAGKPGSFVGTIAVPESGTAPVLTVTATQVVEGRFRALRGHPAEHRRDRPAGAGGAGDVHHPRRGVRLRAAGVRGGRGGRTGERAQHRHAGRRGGQHRGHGLRRRGRPPRWVKVAATSGELVLEATTPTSGNVGEFVVIGLETPRTYVLTFTLEGFSSQTSALDLLAGENRTGIVATLVGGRGTASGSVRDQAGDPIGGASVVVAGNEFEATTSSLTTGGSAGGIGSYRVSDIPVPGSYTITVSAPGFTSETVRVGFVSAGEQSAIDAVLRPSTGRSAAP